MDQLLIRKFCTCYDGQMASYRPESHLGNGFAFMTWLGTKTTWKSTKWRKGRGEIEKSWLCPWHILVDEWNAVAIRPRW